MFQNVITQAKDLLGCSVDEAVNCLNNELLEAAACMKRRVSKGLKSSKWFDVECKAAWRETRKWWRKFRRSKCEESKRKNRLLKDKNIRRNKLNVLTSKMKDSKMFWSEVRSISVGTCRQPLISTNEWFTHFKNVLGGDTNPDKGEEDYCRPSRH